MPTTRLLVNGARGAGVRPVSVNGACRRASAPSLRGESRCACSAVSSLALTGKAARQLIGEVFRICASCNNAASPLLWGRCA